MEWIRVYIGKNLTRFFQVSVRNEWIIVIFFFERGSSKFLNQLLLSEKYSPYRKSSFSKYNRPLQRSFKFSNFPSLNNLNKWIIITFFFERVSYVFKSIKSINFKVKSILHIENLHFPNIIGLCNNLPNFQISLI